jgi:hypothetical protein
VEFRKIDPAGRVGIAEHVRGMLPVAVRGAHFLVAGHLCLPSHHPPRHAHHPERGPAGARAQAAQAGGRFLPAAGDLTPPAQRQPPRHACSAVCVARADVSSSGKGDKAIEVAIGDVKNITGAGEARNRRPGPSSARWSAKCCSGDGSTLPELYDSSTL